jgi:diguanylate cyclase (GGDEF)-like protein/PAS domain S-box-containing protein
MTRRPPRPDPTSAHDEAARLAALRSLGILDTPAEEAFDDIAELAAVVCGTPIAAISLLDSGRQWFKSIVGINASETNRDAAFCVHVISDRDRVLVVPDTLVDDRFRTNPLVVGPPYVRFYAGAPIVTRSGHALGSLCVVDSVPRALSEEQSWVLSSLARQVSRLIEDRSAARMLSEAQSAIDAIISIDAHGQVISFNEGAETIFGYASQDMIGHSVSRLIPAALVGAHTDGLARLRAGGAARLIGETIDVPARRRDGTEFPAELALSAWRRDGQRYFTAVMRDVSAARRSSSLRALVECATAMANDSANLDEALPRVLVELAKGAPADRATAWLADPGAPEDARWRLLVDITADGAPAPGLPAQPPTLIDGQPGTDGSYLGEPSSKHSMVQLPVQLDQEVCAVIVLHGPAGLAADDELRVALLQVGQQLAHVAQRAHTVELTLRALTDPLTGLANRRSILETMQRRLDAPSAEAKGALLFLDLDRFKNVNDSLGHVVGDEVLQVTAERLLSLLRPHDILARMGGDEFVVLCDGSAATAEAANAVAQRLIDGLVEPFVVHGTQVYLGVSIGIALLAPGVGADTTLRQADIAMYRAKNGGGNRSAVFDSDMDRRFRRNLDTDSALHRALENDELVAYFQPIVHPGRRRLVGLEALVRWDRPGHGLVPPDEFISLAEENGLITAIGQHMLNTACRQLAQWTEQYPGMRHAYVAVNVAAAELHPEYLDQVTTILDATGLAPERLTLEITESALLTEVESARELLAKLRTAGIRIALDDFGTGYSSLAYLRQLPIDIIKIDRSFVAPLGTSRRAAALLDVMLGLAEALDLTVVVEGIETATQADTLRTRRCGAVQGYYFSRPVPADQVPALFTANGILRRGSKPAR